MHLTDNDQKSWSPSPKLDLLNNTAIDKDEASE
jgi:hypothetical protein